MAGHRRRPRRRESSAAVSVWFRSSAARVLQVLAV